VNCEQRLRIEHMAAKINISKLMQEIEGFAQISNRRPQPKPPGLFLMQIRTYGYPRTLPTPRVNIRIEMPERPNKAHPVKITHL